MPDLLTVAISAAVSGVGVFVLRSLWEKRKLQWIVFPPVSMMTIHDEVAEKLEISYDKAEITKLAKRRFLLRNAGYRAIDAEKAPLQWQAPGPVLDCGASQTAAGGDSLLRIAVNSDDKRKVDIQWDEYLNPRHQEYVDVLYDECEDSRSVRLLGSRRETDIFTKHVTTDYEQRHTTRMRIMGAVLLGSSITMLAHAFVMGNDGLLWMFLGQFVLIVGIIRAFRQARIARKETATKFTTQAAF
jgi:hypothetical protein